MNTQCALQRSIEAHPEDKLRVKVYADYLQEYAGASQWEALRAAARLRRGVIQAHEMKAALALIDDNSLVRDDLYESIIASCSNNLARVHRLFLVPGSRPPTAVSTYQSNPGAFWYEWHVTVGARWILREAESIEWEIQNTPDDDVYADERY